MLVADIMTPDPVTIRADATLDRAMKLMDEHDFRHIPVTEDGALAGVISDRDLLAATGWLPSRVREAFVGHDSAHAQRVRDVLHAPVMTVAPDDTVVTVAVETAVQGIGCLPVVQDGNLVGIVTEMDLLRAFDAACESGLLTGDVDPPVAALMTKEVTDVTCDTALGDATVVCQSKGIRHLLVVQEERLAGILSDRDLRRAKGAGRHDDFPVDELMQRVTLQVGPETPLSSATALMVEHKVSAVPVTRDERIVGILTITDALDHCMNNLREPESSSNGS